MESTQVQSNINPSNHQSNPDNLISNVNLNSLSNENTSCSRKLIRNILNVPKTLYIQILLNVTIEPMLFLQMLAFSSTTVNIQNYYIECICKETYRNDSRFDCSELKNFPDKEAEIQQKAAIYSTYRSIIQILVPIIFSLFLGPWSDKHGSKIPMILSLFGHAVSSFIYFALSQVETLNPYYLLLASVPIGLTGGQVGFILSAFRFIASVSSTESRSFRIGVAEGIWYLGSPIGLIGSSKILKVAGYEWIFISCTLLYTLAMVYGIIFIKSELSNLNSELNSSDTNNMWTDFFNCAAVKESIITCIRKRPGSKRMWIILLIYTVWLRIITFFGCMDIMLFYTREKFGWDGPTYSLYSSIDGMLLLIGSGGLGILGMRVFKISDKTLGLISAFSYLAGPIVWTIANKSWMIYLGSGLQMFGGLLTIIVRSMLSKIVSKNELGKVYAFLVSGEFAMPLISASLYNWVYIKSIHDFPGAVYLMSSGFNGLILISFIYFFFAMSDDVYETEYLQIEEENEIRT